MNERAVLGWILEDAERNEDHYKEAGGAEGEPYDVLLEDLRNLAGEGAEPPSPLPAASEEAVPLLRSHFKDNVTLISRVLNHLFPEQYLFYRARKARENDRWRARRVARPSRSSCSVLGVGSDRFVPTGLLQYDGHSGEDGAEATRGCHSARGCGYSWGGAMATAFDCFERRF